MKVFCSAALQASVLPSGESATLSARRHGHRVRRGKGRGAGAATGASTTRPCPSLQKQVDYRLQQYRV